MSSYTRALREYGHDVQMIMDEEDEPGDLFWPASDEATLTAV